MSAAIITINEIKTIANVLMTRWMLVDGQWIEYAYVNVPEFGQGWIDNSAFIAWA